MKSREHVNELRRARREKYGNVYEEKYILTVSGFLVRVYQNMKGRVTGLQKKDYPHLYLGKELLDRQLFYDWAKSDATFNSLYENYVLSGRSKKLVPSIDRLDTSKGYTIDNIRWVTLSENCKRAKKVNKFTGQRSEQSIKRQCETRMQNNRINYIRISDNEKFYLSPTEMYLKFGGSKSAYSALKVGRLKKTNGFTL
jgi:hypothetical protein